MTPFSVERANTTTCDWRTGSHTTRPGGHSAYLMLTGTNWLTHSRSSANKFLLLSVTLDYSALLTAMLIIFHINFRYIMSLKAYKTTNTQYFWLWIIRTYTPLKLIFILHSNALSVTLENSTLLTTILIIFTFILGT